MSIICTISCVSAIDCDTNSSEIISDSAPEELSEIYVSVNASDETGDGSSQNPFKSLECAIDNGKNDSTIYLDDGEYVGEKNRNLTIDKSITIIGKSKENTIINAESSGRLFNVTSASRLTLINVTLLNGYSEDVGGSIYSEGGVINIKNCIVRNSTGFNGGVVYNNLGTLNIENSLFINNSAYQYGGVLYTLGTTTIKDSDFTENVINFYKGVGACIATGGKIDLDGCRFYDCFSPYSAGAILNIGYATVNNCRFERLSTNYTAGAISNHKYMLINNSYFGYNDVQYYAGAILAPPSGQHVITEVYNSIIEANHAGYHGAVANNFKDTELYMQNCAIVDNYVRLNEVYGDISLDDNATIQYCWWGQNTINPYYYSPHSGEIAPEKINASRWLIMTFTSENDVIYKDEINRLTVSLKYYFDNETKEIHEYDGDFNLPLDVTFYTNTGALTTKKLVNGVATIDFNPQNRVSEVYAKIDHQILKIDNFQLRKTDIVASDFEAYYGSSSQFVIRLVKDNNIPLSNQELNVTLEGNVYTIKTDNNGQVKLPVAGLAPKVYSAEISYAGSENYQPSSAAVKVTVLKSPTSLTANRVTAVYNGGKYLVATLKDSENVVIKGVKVTLRLNGVTKTLTTNSLGQVKLLVPANLVPKTYVATFKFEGNANYKASGKTVYVLVKKDNTKLISSSKAFNVKSTKKVTAILKDSKNRIIKNRFVTFKVNGINYKVKTNSKGVATATVKLTKKGSFSTVVSFAGDNCYNKCEKTIKVTVK